MRCLKAALLATLILGSGCGPGTPRQSAVSSSPAPLTATTSAPTPQPETRPQSTPSPVASPMLDQPPPVKRGAVTVNVPKLNSAQVMVSAFMEPLVGAEMAQMKGTEFEKSFQEFTVAEPERTYRAKDWAGFMPPGPVKVGQIWKVKSGVASRFLSQIHPTVTEELERDGPGTYATLLARSKTHLDILIRSHAQFWVVNEKLSITPAQFEGHLLVNLKDGSLDYVSFLVPTTHAKNVNYESRAEERLLVGMVFSPRMELEGGSLEKLNKQRWLEHQDLALARDELAKKFFAFEELDWLPLDGALQRAKKESKPIFAIVIEGALNDQSC